MAAGVAQVKKSEVARLSQLPPWNFSAISLGPPKTVASRPNPILT